MIVRAGWAGSGLTWLTVTGLLLGAASWPRPGMAQSVCTFTQITNTSGGGGFEHGSFSISAEGTRVAYVSIGGSVLLFDFTTGLTTPVTNTVGGTSNFVSLNADGTRIALASSQNLIGSNTDGNFEIFRFDTATGVFTQVTDTTGGGTGTPSISADGTRIAFRSPANLTGGNTDGNTEIFLFDDGVFRQLTDTAGTNPVNGGPSSGPWISGDGARIAYRSNRPTTTNADENFEIFLWEGGPTIQVTDTFLGLSNFMGVRSIDGDGARLVFSSTFDLTQFNSDRNGEIFQFAGGLLQQVTDTVRMQMNDTGASTLRNSSNPSISADGGRIAFVSSASDLVAGSNPDGNVELFLWDSGGFTQVTDTLAGLIDLPQLNADGTRVAFRSTRNLTGGNPDGNYEIFVSGCPPPVIVIDSDGDGISDEEDNCPFYGTTLLGDADQDGRGDQCECGDQDGDGRNTVADIVAINRAIFNPSQATPLCDSNDDDRCDVNDIIEANREIFSPTSTSTCERQPVPGD